MYIWFLVKYFDYEIEDYNYINENYSLQKIEDIIKKSKEPDDIFEYVLPPTFNQCPKLEKL